MSFYQFSIGRCHLSRRNGPINLLKIVCFRAKNTGIIGEKIQMASLDVLIDETSGSCLKKVLKSDLELIFLPQVHRKPHLNQKHRSRPFEKGGPAFPRRLLIVSVYIEKPALVLGFG